MAQTRRTMASARSGGKAAKSAIPTIGWRDIRPAAITLLTGPEDFLADRAMRLMRDTLVLEDPSLEAHDLDASDYAAGELPTLASPSLFGEPRLVRVTKAEKMNDAFLADMLRYVEEPADGAYVIVRHASGVRGKKLLDRIRQGGGDFIEVTADEIKRDSDKYDFAASEFRAAKKSITPGALRALVQAFSEDLAELAASCQQLINDTTSTVDEDVVERYYGGRVETNAFKVADAAIEGRTGDALLLLRHALATGADPVPLVAAFAMKIRGMAKVGGTRGGSGQLAKELGMAPWQIDRARRDLAGWTGPGLARAIEAIADTDAQVKGGSRDPIYAIERMVTLIARKGIPVEDLARTR